MKGLNRHSPLLARILISALFILSGAFKIMGFEQTVQFIDGAGIPLATFAAIIAIIVELVGGLAILFGQKVMLAAGALAVYLVIVTLVYHLDLGDQMQLTQFLKNLAVVGGLIALTSSESSASQS